MTAPLDPFAFARPITVRNLRRTCIACPSQSEGEVGETGSIYIRYRWGKFSTRVSFIDFHAVSRTPVYENDIGDRLGGYMATAKMQAHLAGICEFEGPCDEEGWDHQSAAIAGHCRGGAKGDWTPHHHARGVIPSVNGSRFIRPTLVDAGSSSPRRLLA